MGLSYTEELVSEYYKHIPSAQDNKAAPKYFVSERVQFERADAPGWIDIDVLAIGADEICIIQTKAFAIFKNTIKDSIEATQQFFKFAENFVKERYSTDGKKIRKIFIADYGMSKNVIAQFAQADIEPFALKEVFVEYLNILNKRYTGLINVGKEENNLTRIMIFMLYSFREDFRNIFSKLDSERLQ